MEPRQKVPREEFDGPWKDIAEQKLSQLIAFFVPEAWAEIDWERKPVSLNTELRRSRRDAASSDRRADSLFKVYLKRGEEHFVVVHIEAQSARDPHLAQRMFEYGYRAWDRHKKEVSSLVILGDTGPEFRPDRFTWSRWGRLRWKLSLVRRLYERRYSREEIVSLFRLIDWMMHVPLELAIIFEEELESIEEEYQMPYLSSIERRALEKGQTQGFERGQAQGRLAQLRKQLEHRFGPLPDWTADRLGKATPSLLDDWAVRLLDASRVEDVFA